MRFIKLTTLLTILAFLVLISTASFAADDKIVVGKKGEILISQPTRFGDVLLPKGHYRMEHRVVGTDHFLHFAELKMRSGQHMTSSAMDVKHAFPDVKCQTEALTSKVRDTAIHSKFENGEHVVTRVEIRGENVAHVF